MAADQAVLKRGRGRPQVRSDEQTRHVIHEAALPELLAHGYAATRMETIALHAGVSTKTLYRLFPTKAEVFRGIASDRIERYFSELRATPTDDADLAQALVGLLLECTSVPLDPEVIALNRLVIAESGRFPEIAAIFYNEGIRRVPIPLADWLTDQRKRGTIMLDDPKMAAGMLVGMMISEPQRIALLKQGSLPTASALRKRAKLCADLFLEGCRAR